MPRSELNPTAKPSSESPIGLRVQILTRLAIVAALMLLAILPYWGTLDFRFIRDDRRLLDNRWLIEQADARNVWRHDYWFGTRHEQSDLYRPVTVLALAWNIGWDGSPAGFRRVQLGLHASVTLLVFSVLQLIARRLADPEDDPRPTVGAVGAARWGAAIGAALFAVHPLLSENVIFMVGRAEILAAGFGLTAFGLLVTTLDRPSPMRNLPAVIRVGLVGLSSLCLFLALASKESALAWLAILLLWILFRGGLRRSVWLIWGVGVTGWMAATLGFLVLRGAVVGWATHGPPWVDNPLVLHDPLTRACNACLLFARYAAKMVFPRTLSVEYGYDQIGVTALAPWGLVAALVVIGAWVVVGTLLWRRRWVAEAFLWAVVPAAFVVTSNFLLPIGVIFADRLTYLPLIGAAGFTGRCLCRLQPRWLALVLSVVLIGAGYQRTLIRTADFRDYRTYVEATAAASPRAVKALLNVGRTRLRMGQPEEALPPLQRAVELWPDYPRALWVLADTYQALGQTSRADEFRARARVAADKLTAGTSGP